MAPCSYGITGASINDPAGLKARYKFIDATLVIDSSLQPDDNFAVACRNAGMSAILNNANDRGGGGRDTGWYQARKSAGWQAAGGETNSDGEINSVMDAGLIYMDYAGWTGVNSLRSIYSEGIRAHGGGITSWFETYDINDGAGVPYSVSGIRPDTMANIAAEAHSAGAFEVGLLIGVWNIDWGADPYLNLAAAIENRIGSFAGFLIWRGHDGVSCDDCASIAGGLVDQLQSSWPPQTSKTIDQRLHGGVTPGPKPKPKPIPPAGAWMVALDDD